MGWEYIGRVWVNTNEETFMRGFVPARRDQPGPRTQHDALTRHRLGRYHCLAEEDSRVIEKLF